jgi:hypothetical protein
MERWALVRRTEAGELRWVRWAENFIEGLCALDTYHDALQSGCRAVDLVKLSPINPEFTPQQDEVIGEWRYESKPWPGIKAGQRAGGR